MRIKKSHAVIAALAAVIVLPVVIAGAASADEDTQSPLQVLDTGIATLGNLSGSFLDAVNGADRASGTDGTETEFPLPDPHLVDGPVSGLVNDPLG
jgi:hypothetical protein